MELRLGFLAYVNYDCVINLLVFRASPCSPTVLLKVNEKKTLEPNLGNKAKSILRINTLFQNQSVGE